MKTPTLAALLTLSGVLVFTGHPASGATPAGTPEARAQQALAAEPTAVHGSPGDAYQLHRSIVDPDGTTHVRFGRTYHGLPVIGGDFVLHQDPTGRIKGTSVALDRPIVAGVKATVPAARTEQAARDAFSGKAHSVTPARLVIDAISGTGELAWEVVVDGLAPDGQSERRWHALIDAHNATLRHDFDDFHSGTGEGVHNGNVAMGTKLSGSTYQMVDPGHGNMTTCDNNNGSSTCTTFADLNDVWGDGTQANRQSAGVDAHYGAAKTYDFYWNVLGRNGIYGDGSGVTLKVHTNTNWANASWGGGMAKFGDGAGGQDPWTTLDLVGHELSHGLTGDLVTGGLTYSGESGGLNEATSDIFGTMIEFYAGNANDPGDYQLFEELSMWGAGKAGRYMYDPPLDGKSAGCWYNGVGNLDVHYSSGVANHFFFLAAKGSGQTFYGNSPTCDGSTVVGIGRTKVAKIWYRALDAYFVSNESYSDARDSTLAAAEDLYGRCSTEYMTVRAAWAAVGVGTHSAFCLNLKKFYLVATCWPCPPIPDPGPIRELIIIDRVTNPVLEVGVNISHARRGELQIDLVAPDGRSYRLKGAEPRDVGVDVNEVFTVDLGAAYEKGTWTLLVTDTVRGTTGHLEGWSILA